MDYEARKLSSGREVEIRPLGWEVFWELGKMRIAASGRKEEELLRAGMEIRERSLSYCVKGWDILRKSVSLPEALELEKLIDKMSEAPVLEGN